jgi:hypothetical protein
MIPATVYSNPFARILTRLRLSPVLMMSIRYLVRIQISRATAYSGEVFNGIASNDSRISEPAIRLFPDQTDRRLFGFVAPPVQWVIWSSRGAGRRRSTPSTLFTVSIHDRLFCPAIASFLAADPPPRLRRTAAANAILPDGSHRNGRPLAALGSLRPRADAGAVRMLHRPGSVTNDRFQADATLVAYDDTILLGRTPRIPYRIRVCAPVTGAQARLKERV